MNDLAAGVIAAVLTLLFVAYICSNPAAANAHIEVRSAPAREKQH